MYELYFQKEDTDRIGPVIGAVSLSQMGKASDMVQMPVAPEKIKLSVNNRNETIELMNYGEYNIINKAGLSDISFDLEFPSSPRSYASYSGKFREPDYYLNYLEELKNSDKPFRFILIRQGPDGTPMHDTNMLVTLEDYTITDDYDEGFDTMVSINLKQYTEAGTVIVKLKKKKKLTKIGFTLESGKPGKSGKTSGAKSYKVKSGDTLWGICKKVLGDSSKCYEVAKLNKIKNADLIYPGQIIKFP